MTTAAPETVACRALRRDGQRCQGHPTQSGLCTVHDPEIARRRHDTLKNHPEIRSSLPAKAHLKRVAADNAKPLWSRWISLRLLALDMTIKDLGKKLPAAYGWLQHLVRGNRVPLDSTLSMLAPVLGRVPAVVRQAAAEARRSGTAPGVDALKGKIRRWTKDRLVDEIEGLFHPQPVPGELMRQLKQLPSDVRVAKTGAAIYMKARGVRLHRTSGAPPPTSLPGQRRPRGELAFQLSWLRRGGTFLYQCGVCGRLRRLRMSVANRRRDRKGRDPTVCKPCFDLYITSSRGRLWLSEVSRAINEGRSPPDPHPPLRSGRRFAHDDLSNWLQGLIRIALGGKYGGTREDVAGIMNLDEDYVKRGIAIMRGLLTEAEQPSLRNLASSIENIAQSPRSSLQK